MILACSCKYDFQDDRYGVGMRVMNRVPKQQGPDFWRCTVCLTEHAGKEEKREKGKKSKKSS